MSIGQRLKEAREASAMRQEDLAAAVGVSKGAIGNYETDVSSPRDSILIKLMEVLHVDANYIYQDYIRFDEQITSEEKYLLNLYRGSNAQAREDALDLLAKHQVKTPAVEQKVI